VETASVAAIGILVLATAYAFVRKALLSLTYAIAILAVYVLQVTSGLFGIALFSPIVFELGLVSLPGLPPSPWSWLTFEFVHGSEWHVFLNLLGLVFISPTFEERIGSPRWALLYYAGGAFGAFAFLTIHLGQLIVLVGASAGISAVFGAYARLYPRDRVTLFLPIPGMPAIPVAQLVVIFLVLEVLLGLVGPSGIAWEAHAAGIAFGFAAAPAVMRLPIPGRRRAGKAPPIHADLPETRDAWMQKFVASARCPRCGGPLRMRFGRLASPCGWRRAL
jgi:membrane associated rhomboid family serine protease